MTAVRLTASVTGHVQGVGFREWTRRAAERLELAGTAINLPDGRVEVVAEGPKRSCDELLAALRGGYSPGRVRDVEATWSAAQGTFDGFRTR